METSPLPMKGLYSAFMAFEQGGIFIVPDLL
jgi:Tfp pilus assembly protein PilZ